VNRGRGERTRCPLPTYGAADGNRVATLSFSLAGAAFLVAAALRRLNFDEALALRAGFLSLSHIQAEPPFAMPFTVALGALGRAVWNPGAVFLIARIVVALSVLAAMFRSLRRASGEVGVAALAGTLTLLQATFFVHGLEFRYDAAILLAMLLALPALVRGRSGDLLLLGVLSGWLAAHHIKGVVLAMALGVFGVLRARGRPPALGRFVVGALGFVGGWFLLAAALGILPDVLKVYTSFAGVAAGAETRPGPWEALGGTFRRDAVWWLVALAGVGGTLVRFRGRTLDAEVASPDLWALGLAAVPLGFLFVHPHPWPYMLALPAPFLAFLAARRFLEIPSARGRLAATASIVALVGVQSLTRFSPFPVFSASLTARRDTEVATLELLRRVARPGDRIIDPSGLAYFLPPCTRQWYLDSLFREKAWKGTWMAGMKSFDPAACPLVLDTYRLGMLPPMVRERLAQNYVGVSGAIGLWVGDPREREAASWPSLPAGVLDSFW
jgi:hypothetical protein